MNARKPRSNGRKPISLALQGGGSHGAFTWGVVDRLLEDGRLEIKAITGASAGAMNAVVIAAGLLDGGPEGARERLDRFWREVNRAGGQNAFGDLGGWASSIGMDWLKQTPGWQLVQTFAGNFSPYQFNPFNLNPLHDVIVGAVDFAALRERSPVRLYVSATGVRSGESRVFRTEELTCKHVMASACLPHLFQAVEIDGEAYWDGGYLANPALWPLFYDPTPNDVLIVSLNPLTRKDTPRTPGEIIDRLNEITFNGSLVAELRAIRFVRKLIEDGLLKEGAKGRYRKMLMHAIEADGWLDDLREDSKFSTEWGFLQELKSRGRKAGETWLKAHFDDVGVRTTSALMPMPS
ncbi:patatin-like phospholipase family protein [Phenylobacterium montanum]|uniref:Patatin-like phospholipase family protein n=1 Tax=Phenylobacterium montanum TaxID=2823693 RepID=A0A975FZQ3_9CAUL|nr:patatin-like phospholipase family protein [Caulobacter sp. S6]QUD87311.1 patatin-like phospholipase family protein [Caulobacter sp. S6]